MTLNYKKLAKKYEADLLEDLKNLVAIDSSRDVEHKTDEFPLGPGPAKGLQQYLDYAKRDGFTFKNVDNLAGRVEYGEATEDDVLGIIAHADVVPAGDGWDTEAFTMIEKDGKLYGRGTADDKGPGLAAYYALKILKDEGVKLSKPVHFIIGTDEESNWEGLTHYLKSERRPDIVFSPDAEFPIINGEKGIATFIVDFKTNTQDGDVKLISFAAGQRTNMVPHTAYATVSGLDFAKVEADFTEFLKANQLTGDATEENGQINFTLTGKGAHGSEPELGRNAATYLAEFLVNFDFSGQAKHYLEFAANTLHEDFKGEKAGIAHHDELMGDASSSPNIFAFNEDNQTIAINVRYPQGTSDDKITAGLQQTIGDAATVFVDGHAQEPHYVSKDSELVQTLLRVYENQTGNKGHEQIIGGGTYAHIFDNGVAFGAQPETQENVMHQPNEYMLKQALFDAVAIYMEAIYELAK
ncbi:dipeptidase PepV [Holzapfeliella floricola]|uniref:Dipeptidase PepV n=1 Tax=Holzapfeliella floricola DSM 23037 = JCM 16512 TaxID=1423744 RepID=A0A0R2DKB8_9LACO|nr:dipeptidase PepV [Holzapfeliella floricola]KRN04537.1 dipeptidase PepV [Holzapfeliella floricola DSM 23037 = JCM 16512]